MDLPSHMFEEVSANHLVSAPASFAAIPTLSSPCW